MDVLQFEAAARDATPKDVGDVFNYVLVSSGRNRTG